MFSIERDIEIRLNLIRDCFSIRQRLPPPANLSFSFCRYVFAEFSTIETAQLRCYYEIVIIKHGSTINYVKMIRQPFYRTLMILIMLTSWLFMLVTSTCAMPIMMQTPVEKAVIAADCDDATHHVDFKQAQTDLQKKDCLLKPCSDSQQNPALNSKIAKLDIPVFILCLIGLSAIFYNPSSLRVFRRWQTDDFANSVPIRYRFCVLRN
ncbi:MAG: hypothetical protein ACXWAS_02545 [Methylobacter sp.]